MATLGIKIVKESSAHQRWAHGFF